MAESNEGYIRLREETECLVATFQSELKKKIVSVADLEVKLIQAQIREDLAKTLLVCTKALLICDALTADPHQIVNTIIEEYHSLLLEPFAITAADFRSLYKLTHGLAVLPTPIPMLIQNPTSRDGPQIPTAVYQTFVKIYKVIENVFLSPWEKYKSTQTRLDISTALKNLRVDHLVPPATEAATMLIDEEPAVAPPQLRDIIDTQVNKKTASIVVRSNSEVDVAACCESGIGSSVSDED